MSNATAILASAVLGTIANNESRKPIPAHDSELCKLIAENPDKEMGASLPLLNAWLAAWLAAWHAANLARPIA